MLELNYRISLREESNTYNMFYILYDVKKEKLGKLVMIVILWKLLHPSQKQRKLGSEPSPRNSTPIIKHLKSSEGLQLNTIRFIIGIMESKFSIVFMIR